MNLVPINGGCAIRRVSVFEHGHFVAEQSDVASPIAREGNSVEFDVCIGMESSDSRVQLLVRGVPTWAGMWFGNT